MIRVVSVPAGHPYVASIAGLGYAVLPDPPVPGAPAGQWWPPVALDAAWIRAHAADFDLLHVHFGTESRSADELEAVVAALREVGRPLVYTAHDLDHPHLADQAAYRAQLDILVPGAGAVLTLTEHAAREIAARWGVQARVVPHPQLATDDLFARADALRRARAGEPAIVAIHLRELRANVRPEAWIAPLAAATHALAGTPLRILVNDGPATAPAVRERLDRTLAGIAAEAPGIPVEVIRRPRPGDEALALELAAADVSVLPYAHGTHSGWLELCWDLGTRVLMPEVGAMAGQHREPWFAQAFDPERPAEIARALEVLLAAPAPPAAAERLAARREVARVNAEAHRETYERLVGAGTALAPAASVEGPTAP